MRKFFVDKDNIKGSNIFIFNQDRKHIVDVLRLSIGDSVIVNNSGINYHSKIVSIDDEKITLEIINKKLGENEPITSITLFQGLAKGDKMDYIVQKGTEIGVKSFYGVQMERSVVKAKDNKWKNNRVSRYNKIAKEASKQCKRDIIPEFKNIVSFDNMLNILREEDYILVPYESEGDNTIKKVLSEIEDRKINIVIGPEGGFSDKEIKKLKEIGARTVSLSNRIFRTETAGIVASVITLYELENIGVI